MDFCEKTCVPCQGGILPLTESQATALMVEVPLWRLEGSATRIERTYQFPNFVSALEFVNQVGRLCETEWHHADITFGWGYCSIVFFTHKIKGLHENDFIIAAKVDRLYETMPKTE